METKVTSVESLGAEGEKGEVQGYVNTFVVFVSVSLYLSLITSYDNKYENERLYKNFLIIFLGVVSARSIPRDGLTTWFSPNLMMSVGCGLCAAAAATDFSISHRTGTTR